MAEKKRILDGLVDLGADKDDDECFRKAVEAVKNGTDSFSRGTCFGKYKSMEEEMDDHILRGGGVPQISYTGTRLTDPAKDPMVIYKDRMRRIVKQVHEMISRNEKPADMPEGLARIYKYVYEDMMYYVATSDDERQKMLSQVPNNGTCEGGRDCFLKAVEVVRANLIKQIHDWIENNERPDDMWPCIARMYDAEFAKMKADKN